MKLRDFIDHLHKYDCYLLREGGNHSIYKNLQNHKISAVPRHKEIRDRLVKKICKDLQIPSPGF
jgi:mRNA interferase HicA